MMSEKIQAYLNRLVISKEIPHALLFCGHGPIARQKTALDFFKTIHCQNKTGGWFCNACDSCNAIDAGRFQDLLILRPENRQIGIEQIRTLRNFIALSPAHGGFKTVLIENADSLNKEASNALLKTLEEPSLRTVLILETDLPFTLTETIRSRVQTIRFPGEDALSTASADTTTEDKNKNYADEIKELIKDPLWEKFIYVENFMRGGGTAVTLVETMLVFFRRILLRQLKDFDSVPKLPERHRPISSEAMRSNKTTVEFIKLLSHCAYLLKFTNANQRYLLELLMLKLDQFTGENTAATKA